VLFSFLLVSKILKRKEKKYENIKDTKKKKKEKEKRKKNKRKNEKSMFVF
jgi:hypothetical protein